MRERSGIPTEYKGIRFRSRLEATWARIFDTLGWDWEYEPFDLAGWIPDFVFPGPRDVLVEVKPVTTRAALRVVLDEIPADVRPTVALGATLWLSDWSSRGVLGVLRGPDGSYRDAVIAPCEWCVRHRLQGGLGHLQFLPCGHEARAFGWVEPDELDAIERAWASAKTATQWKPR